MSKRHPVVAVTGSSGAGTSTVKRAFEHIFAREDIVPAVVEGDSYHRFERMPMKKAMADALSKGENFSHFGPEANLFDKLEELFKKIDDHPRKEICLQSIKNWGLIVICENYESCVELSNNFAPEHLEILTKDSKKILAGIENAGAIFLGKWTPEAVGDYLAGPNHTLPTSGNSRFSGSLGVETFMKNTSIIEFNEESLKVNSLDIINLAKSEGLHSHANSVEIRFED